jgi:hypothetical protein
MAIMMMVVVVLLMAMIVVIECGQTKPTKNSDFVVLFKKKQNPRKPKLASQREKEMNARSEVKMCVYPADKSRPDNTNLRKRLITTQSRKKAVVGTDQPKPEGCEV